MSKQANQATKTTIEQLIINSNNNVLKVIFDPNFVMNNSEFCTDLLNLAYSSNNLEGFKILLSNGVVSDRNQSNSFHSLPKTTTEEMSKRLKFTNWEKIGIAFKSLYQLDTTNMDKGNLTSLCDSVTTDDVIAFASSIFANHIKHNAVPDGYRKKLSACCSEIELELGLKGLILMEVGKMAPEKYSDEYMKEVELKVQADFLHEILKGGDNLVGDKNVDAQALEQKVLSNFRLKLLEGGANLVGDKSSDEYLKQLVLTNSWHELLNGDANIVGDNGTNVDEQ